MEFTFDSIENVYDFIMWLAEQVLGLGRSVLHWFNTPLNEYLSSSNSLVADFLSALFELIGIADVTPFYLLLATALPLFVLFTLINFFSRIL